MHRAVAAGGGGALVTCASCFQDVTITLVIAGRGGVSHVCRRCYFVPKDVVVVRSRKK